MDILMTSLVVIGLAAVTAALATSFPPKMRAWVWFALAEYMVCAAAQLVYARVIVEGGDTLYYTENGAGLAKLLEANFDWASRELLAMFLQQPSVFDKLVDSPQSNTSSMYAAVAWLLFLLRGATTAAPVVVSGLSLFACLSIYRAFSAVWPEAPQVRLFTATVLFPSVAFWTSALHKEAFCLIGIGALLAGWRALYARRYVRAIVFAAGGLGLMSLFRAPAIPPVMLGLVVYVAVERFQKFRGADAVILGPVYLAVALGALALTMVVVSRVSPSLSLDQLGDTVTLKQQGWALSRGGSSFVANEDALAQTLSAQLLRFPLGLVNALFRPQLFDVHNVAALVSAIEMTVITVMIIRAVRHHGAGGILLCIQRSPFVLMCAVVTLVGCTFVGLVTLNFGSLARYRVPFLPFYGALVVALSPLQAREAAKPRGAPVRRAPRRAAPPAQVAASRLP